MEVGAGLEFGSCLIFVRLSLSPKHGAPGSVQWSAAPHCVHVASSNKKCSLLKIDVLRHLACMRAVVAYMAAPNRMGQRERAWGLLRLCDGSARGRHGSRQRRQRPRNSRRMAGGQPRSVPSVCVPAHRGDISRFAWSRRICLTTFLCVRNACARMPFSTSATCPHVLAGQRAALDCKPTVTRSILLLMEGVHPHRTIRLGEGTCLGTETLLKYCPVAVLECASGIRAMREQSQALGGLSKVENDISLHSDLQALDRNTRVQPTMRQEVQSKCRIKL